MARFQIVTDTTTYTEGESTTVFKELGFGRPVLKSFKEKGDWIELTYSGALTIAIPESRIQYIAEAI